MQQELRQSGRFVDPHGPAEVSPLPEEHSFQRHVLNPALQNVLAGIGMAVVARWLPELIRSYTGWGWEAQDPNKNPMLMGVILFGLLCIFRFSRDEISDIVLKVSMRLYEIKLDRDIKAQIDYYDGRITQLLNTNKDLQAQLEVYGGISVGNPLTAAEVAERKNLAQKMYTRLVNNLPITRDECLRTKAFESRGEWATARQFLVDAGVIEPSGKPLAAAVAQGSSLIESYAQTLMQTRVPGARL
jgi:hypothetical protein